METSLTLHQRGFLIRTSQSGDRKVGVLLHAVSVLIIQKMKELLEKAKYTISRQIKNLFEDDELKE